jgi:hypothetical protein
MSYQISTHLKCVDYTFPLTGRWDPSVKCMFARRLEAMKAKPLRFSARREWICPHPLSDFGRCLPVLLRPTLQTCNPFQLKPVMRRAVPADSRNPTKRQKSERTRRYSPPNHGKAASCFPRLVRWHFCCTRLDMMILCCNGRFGRGHAFRQDSFSRATPVGAVPYGKKSVDNGVYQ